MTTYFKQNYHMHQYIHFSAGAYVYMYILQETMVLMLRCLFLFQSLFCFVYRTQGPRNEQDNSFVTLHRPCLQILFLMLTSPLIKKLCECMCFMWQRKHEAIPKLPQFTISGY